MNRVSESYIATLKTLDKNFDEDLKIIKERVKKMNLDEKEAGSDLRYRVCLRGRRPFKKMVAPKPYWNFLPHSPNPVSYDYFGNIVGGLENASEVDVYVYERR
jgi:hypothetical protein